MNTDTQNQLQIVKLKTNISLIEVMRRFHKSPKTNLIRATHTRRNGSYPDYWSVHFIGESPDLYGLAAIGDQRIPDHNPVHVN